MNAVVNQTGSEPNRGDQQQTTSSESASGQEPHFTATPSGNAAMPKLGTHSTRPFRDPVTDFDAGVVTHRLSGQSTVGVPSWILRLLRMPLLVKLLGANVLLLFVAGLTALWLHRVELSSAPILTVVVVAYLVALLMNTCLIIIAVRPLRELEKTVDTIWRGNLDARVPASLLADRQVTRVARMVNVLLDRFVADRERTRRLASEIIGAGDRERAAISRELHDSVAQALAALGMQLGVAARSIDARPDTLHDRIEEARTLANNTLEEIRVLAHSMHPRVLDDLGLIAALRRLARETTDHSAIDTAARQKGAIFVEVVATDGSDDNLPSSVKSVLYRVAQEAVLNARRHAAPKRVEISLAFSAQSVTLEIADDGRGVDVASSQLEQSGIGLFTMRERVALVNGELSVNRRAGGGTSVVASVPLYESSLITSDRVHI